MLTVSQSRSERGGINGYKSRLMLLMMFLRSRQIQRSIIGSIQTVNILDYLKRRTSQLITVGVISLVLNHISTEKKDFREIFSQLEIMSTVDPLR